MLIESASVSEVECYCGQSKVTPTPDSHRRAPPAWKLAGTMQAIHVERSIYSVRFPFWALKGTHHSSITHNAETSCLSIKHLNRPSVFSSSTLFRRRPSALSPLLLRCETSARRPCHTILPLNSSWIELAICHRCEARVTLRRFE
jgi:hypothetical protein